MSSFKRLKVLDISYPDILFEITDALFASGYHARMHIHVPVNLTELYAKNLWKGPGEIRRVKANITSLCILPEPNINSEICYIGRDDNLKNVCCC